MNRVIYFLLVVALISCEIVSEKPKSNLTIKVVQKHTFLDSLKSVCVINKLDTFDYNELFTNDFSKMTRVSDDLMQKMAREEFEEGFLHIRSYIPNNREFLTLILYQKNYEGQDYRADKTLLVNLDSTGKVIDEIVLATQDNISIQYEVNSYFKEKDILFLEERMSSESYFNPSRDTLFTTKYLFKINTKKGIDTISKELTKEERLF